MPLLGLILPSWTKYAALAALALAIWGHGYATASGRAERRLEALRAAEAAEYLKGVERAAKVNDRVVTVYMDRVRVIEQAAQAKIKEVIKYVSVKADNACVVPVGLVRLWNDADPLQTSIYTPASDSNDTASGLALSAVGGGAIEARRRFELNKAQCHALQAWVDGVGNANPK